MSDEKGPVIIKTQEMIKAYFPMLILVFSCLVYIGYGFATIKESGRSTFEIIASGFVSFVIGFTIKLLLGKQGLLAGEASELYQSTRLFYSKTLEQISPISQYLDAFCEEKNKQFLVKRQKEILRREGIEYKEEILKDTYLGNLSKEKKRCIEKARKANVKKITVSILLSDGESDKEENESLYTSQRSYEWKRNGKNAIMMLLCSVIFGYYVLSIDNLSWSGVLWSSIQVALYLLMGSIEYSNGYYFKTQEYRNKIIRKCNYLEEFLNTFQEGQKEEKEALEKEDEREPFNE